MSVYETAVSAYRDTTKWLVAFAPVTTVVSAAVVLGPTLVTSTDTATDPLNWIALNWGVAICGLALSLSIGAILYFGARVLSVAPDEIGRLQEPEFAPRLAAAIGEGVTAPEFFDKTSFDTAMAELANAWDQGTPISTEDPRLTRLRGPVESLRQWSIFDQVRQAFVHFCVAFVIASLAIAAAVIAAASQLDETAAIDKPTSVLITTDDAGRADLGRHTGCRDVAATVFTAVGGTWARPELAVAGPGCRFGSTWHPDPDHLQVRIPK